MEREKKKLLGTEYRLLDLFAGVGGIRLGFEENGCKCVFSSEWDKAAANVYEENFGERPAGDITLIEAKDIPSFDILTGGFPCQSFSAVGVSARKARGLKHGFEDEKKGNLFFEITRILEHHKPPAFMLENVKNLVRHNLGETFKIIVNTLQQLNYTVHTQVINSNTYVPQRRERIYIVGFNNDLVKNPNLFEFPTFNPTTLPKLKDILEENVPDVYTLTDAKWKAINAHKEKQKTMRSGFGFYMADLEYSSKTLLATYGRGNFAILIPQEGKNPRKLTARECARLMGFPESFKLSKFISHSYSQMGNSVVVPVVSHIAENIVDFLDHNYLPYRN